MNEREFSDRIKTAFPDGEISDTFTARLSSGTPAAKKRIKPGYAAVSVAAAALILGSVGSYAASSVTFRDIFSGYIHVADNELAESLMGTVSGFEYKVSDADYAIRIIGVTGARDNIIGRAEIYRKDGKPVKDFFKNLPENDDSVYAPFSENLRVTHGGSRKTEFNEDGNLEIYWNIDSSHRLSGKRIAFSGTDVFNYKLAEEFAEKNNCKLDDVDGKLYLFESHNGDSFIQTDITLEEVAGLSLSWSFSFRYRQAALSVASKKCSDLKEHFTLTRTYSLFDFENDGGPSLEELDDEVICIPSSMEFSSTGGTIKFTYSDDFDFDSYISEKYPGKDVRPRGFINNALPEMYLIRSDGTRVYMRMGNISSNGVLEGFTETCKVKGDIIYYDPEITEGASQIYTDISDVTAAYINGVTYQLK